MLVPQEASDTQPTQGVCAAPLQCEWKLHLLQEAFLVSSSQLASPSWTLVLLPTLSIELSASSLRYLDPKSEA